MYSTPNNAPSDNTSHIGAHGVQMLCERQVATDKDFEPCHVLGHDCQVFDRKNTRALIRELPETR